MNFFCIVFSFFKKYGVHFGLAVARSNFRRTEEDGTTPRRGGIDEGTGTLANNIQILGATAASAKEVAMSKGARCLVRFAQAWGVLPCTSFEVRPLLQLSLQFITP